MKNTKLWRIVLLGWKHTFSFRTRVSIARKWQAYGREVMRDADAMAPDLPDNVSVIPHHGPINEPRHSDS